MERIRAGGLLVFVAMLGVEAHGAPTQVSGRVVGADGGPVAGAEVAKQWIFEAGKVSAFGGAKTDGDGRFQVEADFSRRSAVTLMALDADRKVGGLVILDAAQVANPIEIKLGPLVRVHGNFSCRELGDKVPWTNMYMLPSPGKSPIAECRSDHGDFDLKLPVGKYSLFGYGSDDVTQIRKPLELSADQPDLDVGTLDLPASPLGKMYDKEAPPLHITDARGINKEMKLTDFRGKWVVLDFWGYWCGPCVGDSLPDLMQIWDEHPDDRDKFVVLAFHDKQAENFAQLDEKLVPIVRDTWNGRELPFPILLDSTGKTVEEYGIHSWPTTILINPEGKVVRGGQYALRKALPEVPIARRIPLALDKPTSFGLTNGTKLDGFVKFVGPMAHLKITLDEPALRAAGVARDAMIPLAMSGQVSLRSWLELALQPLGLVAVPGPEGLVVTTPQPGAKHEPSVAQNRAAARINQKLAAPTSFDFNDRTMTEVISHFEERTGETFVLDPADRLADRLDPKATVSGKVADIPLRDGLKSLFGPVGIQAVVRNEVVVLSKPTTP